MPFMPITGREIYTGIYTDAMTGEERLLPEHVEEDMAPWSYRVLIAR